MTRLAILADIHANLPALEAVEADFTALGVDHVVVAGDTPIGAPFPRETTELVLARGWAVIRGNNEIYATDFASDRAKAEWRDPIQFSLVHWSVERLPERARAAIAAWPDTLTLRYPDAPLVRVVHGSPRGHFENMSHAVPEPDMAAMLADVEEPYVASAHTHRAMDRQVGRWRVLNPGSVGQPLDGNPEAGYMVLDAEAGGWRVTHRRVPYDRERLFAAYESTGLLERCGIIGELVYEEARESRTRLAPFLRWRRATCPDAPFDAELLRHFRSQDVWRWTSAHFQVNR